MTISTVWETPSDPAPGSVGPYSPAALCHIHIPMRERDGAAIASRPRSVRCAHARISVGVQGRIKVHRPLAVSREG